ncbi:hypothetical protein PEBR_43018 [Penicillium brasilianum]|uniref:Uncharacterized protein n=1 Tax=Penicillium brasilianum TaxID=104259 RepID=A0A1S9R894_PENBI|nr:hypothetical protein PEBR_43018 [Penicillium brasilianum]
MIIFRALLLTGFVTSAIASAPSLNLFYGKYGFSKLRINKVVAEKNCGCSGTWDPPVFANISEHFGASLAELIPSEKTDTSGKSNAISLSIGQNTYTLALDYSEGYFHPHASNATVWARLISDMLVVGNYTPEHSIITGEYINTIGGTHNLTLTVYGEATCSGVFEPCAKVNPSEIVQQPAGVTAGARLDWSDKETLKKHIQYPVYNTTSLHELIITNASLPAFVYHEDIGAVVDTSTIRIGSNNIHNLQERQCVTSSYYAFYNEGAWATWGQWTPTSGCLYTGLDDAGGSLGFSIGFSMSYAESWSFGGNGIVAGLSPSFTFTLTEQYSWTWSYTCNVPANSVGQVYQRQFAGYGYVYAQLCYNAGACGITCGAAQGPNYAGAPDMAVLNYGCSTGCSNVACASYPGWTNLNVWSPSPPNSC